MCRLTAQESFDTPSLLFVVCHYSSNHNATPSQHYNSQIPFSGYGEDVVAYYGYPKLMLFYG